MLYSVYNQFNQVVGQIEAGNIIEAWEGARKVYEIPENIVFDVRESEVTAFNNKEFYHATRVENLPIILSVGLLPPSNTDEGLGGKYRKRGIYLADSLEIMDMIMEDYEYREDRVPGNFALLKVILPNDWSLEIDPEVVIKWKPGHAFVSYQAIPPMALTLLNEHYYTISQYGVEVRELPGEFANIGSRVRVVSTNREGIVTGVISFSHYETIYLVKLDGEAEVSKISSKDLVELVP